MIITILSGDVNGKNAKRLSERLKFLFYWTNFQKKYEMKYMKIHLARQTPSKTFPTNIVRPTFFTTQYVHSVTPQTLFRCVMSESIPPTEIRFTQKLKNERKIVEIDSLDLTTIS